MVSAMCHVQSVAPPVHRNFRMLHLDATKNYSTPLQVETSVEYDLPQHIYPPKGAAPILIVHPAYVAAMKQKKLSVSSPTLSATSNSSPKHKPRYISSDSQSNECKCVLGKIPPYYISSDCSVHAAVKQPPMYPRHPFYEYYVNKSPMQENNIMSQTNAVELQRHIQQQAKHYKLADRIAQTQNEQLHNSFKSATEQLFPWAVNKYTLPGSSVVTNAHADLAFAQSVPTTYLTRAASRSTAVGSPKVRTRTRRGVNASNVVPDYSLARPSRSAGTGVALQNQVQQRSRSSAQTSCSNSVTLSQLHHQNLERLKSMNVSNNSLVTPSFNQSTSSMLSTVGQSVDSGCSLGGDTIGSTNMPVYYNAKASCMIKPTDSGFSTPVDPTDDIAMECMDYSSSSSSSNSSRNSGFNSSMRDFWSKQTPKILASSGSHNAFLSPSKLHPPYYQAPAPLLNLAY